MKHRITFLCIILLLMILNPCSVVSAGDWIVYNSVGKISQIKYFNDRIYGVSGKSLISFSTDQNNLDYQLYSRNDGFTSNYIRFIESSKAADCLAIIYDDCNIDILYADEKIINLADIANKPIAGDKIINSVQEIDGSLYIACSFGILVIDLNKQIVSVSVPTPYPIDFAFCFKNNLYRYSSNKQLEYCPMSSNLSDNSNWIHVDTNTLIDAQIVNGEKQSYCWMLDSNGTLLQLNNPQTIETLIPDKKLKNIHKTNSFVVLSGESFILAADPDQRTFTQNTDSPINSGVDYECKNNDEFYMLHPNGNIYYMSILQYNPNVNISFNVDFENVLITSGINTPYLGDIQLTDNGATGISRLSYITSQPAAHSLLGAISHYDAETGTWRNVDVNNAISNKLDTRKTFVGLTGLAVDPTDESHYAISAGMHGLYVMQNDTLLHRYDDLSGENYVEAASRDYLSTRVSSVAFDDEGRLYFANALQDAVLRCITPDGHFYKYPNAGMSQVPDPRRILISKNDKNHYKWLLNDYGYKKSRIGIYYDQANPNTIGTSTYQTAWFNVLIDQDNNEYTPNYIYDLCEDLDGRIWVLTNIGPFVIENQKSTFDYAQKNPGKGKVHRIKVPRNDGTNLADYLLQSTSCTCMVIDKNNQKWVGTNGNGLYLLSDDCLTEFKHFTADNSPLISNDILTLCYNPTRSELLVSCEGGVLSYKTNDDEGKDNLESVYCYPNPVRPDYYGELNIMGLMEKSIVSVTTSSGKLLFKTTAHGASVSWNLMDSSGDRVTPGVYLIHVIEPDNKEGKICKVLVL